MSSEHTPAYSCSASPGVISVTRRGSSSRGLRRVGRRVGRASILDDPTLAKRYAEEVPVTFVDGQQHAIWRVDEDRLRSALAGSIAQPT